MTKDEIVAALKAEGQTVHLKSWEFGGLNADVLPAQFKAYTLAKYGIPVEVNWDISGDALLQQAEQANKLPSELGLDVIDNEEDHNPKLKEQGWIEQINQPQYANVLTNWTNVDPGYITDNGLGVVYQGFEWLAPVARKDKVDAAAIKDWTDLANPALKGKILMYPLSEDRGQLIFYAILNSLVKQGIVPGPVFSQDAVKAGLQWFKKNIEPNVLKYVDTGEMRTKMQSGEAGIAITWGSYVRELLSSDWNQRDNVLVPIYPTSGISPDRETIRVAKGTTHPVGARVLIDWMMSRDFVMLGWYKDTPTGTETNHWNLTKQQFLGNYAGGIFKDDRALLPDFAKPFYPDDPGALTLPFDYPFFQKNRQWLADQYQAL
jgi:ABC-type Fe3+ transport system substrate-binding protein